MDWAEGIFHEYADLKPDAYDPVEMQQETAEAIKGHHEFLEKFKAEIGYPTMAQDTAPNDQAGMTFGETKQDNSIRFIVDDNEILVIDKEGIVYNGERVKDAGEAYNAYMSAMGTIAARKQSNREGGEG